MSSKAKYFALAMVITSGLRLMLSIKSCNEKQVKEAKAQTQSEVVEEDAFIIEKSDKTLHYGNVLKTASGDYVLKLNCGKMLFTDEFDAYTKLPSEEVYEHKCSTCYEKEREL